MTAKTQAVQWLLARAAARSYGLLHVVSERSSGLLNPICGANQIRSEVIERRHQLDDPASLCAGCATIAASIGGTVRDGVALLLGLSTSAATARLLEVPVTEIDLAPAHARRDPGDLDGLTDSIAVRGLVVPVVLRRTGTRFEVIDGARRIAAAHAAGLATVPAVVRDATDDAALVDGLLANLHRADLNPIDAAHAYERALEQLGCSKAELGRRLGISREQVSNTIRLLALPEAEQMLVAAGELTAQAARGLLAAPRVPAERLTDVSALLEQLLAATVKVTARGGRTRIVIDVDNADSDRILQQLGATAVAA